MKILHITSINNVDGNGVAVAVSNYVKYESSQVEIAMYNIESDLYVDKVSNYNYSEYKSISQLPDGFSKPDLIIFNEVYKKEYIKLYKECVKLKVPYIIIPHGCLTKSAQRQKRYKKLPANILFFNRFLSSASAIQYLNEKERNNSIEKKNKFIIYGNGIENITDKHIFLENFNIVFIGRYSIYHKGLDILINACKIIKEFLEKNKISVCLYGRESNNSVNELQKIIDDNKLNNVIKLNGPVYAESKDKVLREASIFIQTSRQEGQPMGIIEALAYGIPCIVTKGTSFAEYVNDNICGIGVDLDEKQVAASIIRIYKEKENLPMYSNNAHLAIKRDFLWPSVIENTLCEYKKIIDEYKEQN